MASALLSTEFFGCLWANGCVRSLIRESVLFHVCTRFEDGWLKATLSKCSPFMYNLLFRFPYFIKDHSGAGEYIIDQSLHTSAGIFYVIVARLSHTVAA